jgi:hypothetical protein
MIPLSILRGVGSSCLRFCRFMGAPVNAAPPVSDEHVAVQAGKVGQLPQQP